MWLDYPSCDCEAGLDSGADSFFSAYRLRYKNMPDTTGFDSARVESKEVFKKWSIT